MTRALMRRTGLAAAFSAWSIWGATLLAVWRPTASSAPIRYADGAPAGFSGGFGEESCHACHFSAEPNQAPGRVTIAGVPAAFVAGRTYTLRVTLTRTEMALAGFQLSARFAEGGAQAGTLAPRSDDAARVKIETRNGVQYAGQGQPVAPPPGSATATWTLDWTAPAAGGAVSFHVAANAADNDGSAGGDFIYTSVATATPAQ